MSGPRSEKSTSPGPALNCIPPMAARSAPSSPSRFPSILAGTPDAAPLAGTASAATAATSPCVSATNSAAPVTRTNVHPDFTPQTPHLRSANTFMIGSSSNSRRAPSPQRQRHSLTLLTVRVTSRELRSPCKETATCPRERTHHRAGNSKTSRLHCSIADDPLEYRGSLIPIGADYLSNVPLYL